MKNWLKKEWRLAVLGLFLFGNIFVWYAVYRESPSKYLIVAFLTVGQGDAIYIESPTHNRIMVDGGPSRAVMGELQKFLPFYARTFDTLVVTNPDADHFSGFIDMLAKYKVNRIIEPGTISNTARWAELKKSIADKKIEKVLARRGMTLHLGSGAELDILFPDRDVASTTINDGSIIAKLTYGGTSVMLTGDAPNKTEEYVLSLDGVNLKSDILKAGHHGSRTSASETFISAVNPRQTIISAGLKNRYGHPHKETLDLLKKLNIPYLITFERGTITAISDGLNFQIKTDR